MAVSVSPSPFLWTIPLLALLFSSSSSATLAVPVLSKNAPCPPEWTQPSPAAPSFPQGHGVPEPTSPKQ